ncbi:MAG TPA: thioesterase family protein [Puia sp.]|nr:thioesterase family protein [Puia sp.]
MESYIKPLDLRWADLDPNFHLRHSVYYDYAAFCRISFLQEHGLAPRTMAELQFGPILFREEAVFRKEVRPGDQLSMDIQLTKSRRDFSRWSIRHQLFKNGDVVSAVITVDGAWINTRERKLATPPALIVQVFEIMPRSQDFEWHIPGA